MHRFIANLQQFEPGIDAEQIASILWLAQQLTVEAQTKTPASSGSSDVGMEIKGDRDDPGVKQFGQNEAGDKAETARLTVDAVGRTAPDIESETSGDRNAAEDDMGQVAGDDRLVQKPAGIPIRAAAARSLRRPIELERALRPLRRRVPARSRYRLDEVATAEKFAETQVKVPVVQAEQESWLDLALVVEQTSLTEIWQRTIDEFQWLLEHLGAFRDVRVWTMRRNQQQQLELLPRHQRQMQQGRSHSFKELLDPSGRRLILVLSDCTSVAWWEGQVHEWLTAWSAVNLVTVMQLLPQRMWKQGILGEGMFVQLHSQEPVVCNGQWQVAGLPVWRQYTEPTLAKQVEVTLPVVTLEPGSLQQWARAVSGVGEFSTVGVLFEEGWRSKEVPPIVTKVDVAQEITPETIQANAKEIVRQFRATASPMARRLAGLMAVAPVNLRVIELIQETLLPESQQMHVAEVFLGGLLERGEDAGGKSWFQFRQGVRQELRASLSKTETQRVLDQVSEYIAARLGLPLRSFSAFLLAEDLPEEVQGDKDVVAFAEVALDSLRQMGGQYAVFAEQVSARPPTGLKTFEFEVAEYVEETTLPIELQTFEFDVLTLQQEKEDEQEATSDPLAALNWRRISFAVATLDQQNRISTRQAAAWEYAEEIQFELTGKSSSATISLEMVAIPGGDFQMGSKDESTEQPIHVVKVQPFFMGKYPVTQAQWQAVAKLPKIYQSLQSNPSRFKGDDRPIENISWHDAIEFCARLSKHTAREYRLPTEAEWEYACRAGTTTQYHFGDELTNELANYSSANSGTTPAGKFLYTNAFGLYDMHGNVWEWCMDCWHENYEKAPIDGSAWLDEDAPKNARRVLRGGSWNFNPWACRSASRDRLGAVNRISFIGFRILSPARILP
jgi:formylglycine-generating enzyme required for sulfatase activity